MLVSENPDLTRRRGRWLTNKIMEIYVQEVSAIQFIPHLPKDAKKQISDGAEFFPWMLEHVEPTVWPIFFQEEATKFETNG